MNSSSTEDYLGQILHKAIGSMQEPQLQGRVVQVVGSMIKAIVPRAKVGELCVLHNPWEEASQMSEVIGFEGNAAILMPFGELVGISADTLVLPQGDIHKVPVGEQLLGRVLDGLGRPIDTATAGALHTVEQYPVYNEPPGPLQRAIITEPLELGVRCLDGLLTCGEGQRMGIFAPAGGGKSTLLAQVLRNTQAEIVVLALIGERGREVREFIERDLGEEGLKRSIIVVSTSDRPALERLKAAYVATSIAEYFRDKEKKVLLMMDSVTRFARAQREVGLSAGEPPARRGFPPSVFSTLPKLMERAGCSDKGSITALYTVLVEGDDMTEPVADETRSILDGHIILSRKLASANHYPAIDVLESISRVMGQIVDKEHSQAAGKIRSLMAKYQEIELLVRVGEYQKGADAEGDRSLKAYPLIEQLLCQGVFEKSTLPEAVQHMSRILNDVS